MYPWIGLPLELARFPNTTKWMARLAERPSFTQSISPRNAENNTLLTEPQIRFTAPSNFKTSGKEMDF